MALRRRHRAAAVASMAIATKPPQRLRSIRFAACASIPRPPSIGSLTTDRIISSARRAAANVSKPSRKNSCSRNRPNPRHRPAPSTPVRCIPRCGRSARAVVRSAAWRWSPNRSRSTMRRIPNSIDMTRRFWIALALTLPVFAIEMGSHLGHLRPDASGAAGMVELDFVGVVDAGGAVGGRAVLRARLEFADHAQSQHVHADRDGHRRGLGSTAWSARWRRNGFRRRSATCTAWSRCISRRRPSLRFWCCWGRCWNCGRASAPRARSARCSGSRRKPRGASPSMATKMSRSMRSRSAIACGCGPARRFRSMASSPKAALSSMSPW